MSDGLLKRWLKRWRPSETAAPLPPRAVAPDRINDYVIATNIMQLQAETATLSRPELARVCRELLDEAKGDAAACSAPLRRTMIQREIGTGTLVCMYQEIINHANVAYYYSSEQLAANEDGWKLFLVGAYPLDGGARGA